jgi:hypothetical protein
MPSKRRVNDLVLFSSRDPKPLVEWLVETHGLQNILRLLSEQGPGGTSAPTKRAYKKRGAQKGSKKSSGKGGKRGRRNTGGGGAGEVGNGK